MDVKVGWTLKVTNGSIPERVLQRFNALKPSDLTTTIVSFDFFNTPRLEIWNILSQYDFNKNLFTFRLTTFGQSSEPIKELFHIALSVLLR